MNPNTGIPVFPVQTVENTLLIYPELVLTWPMELLSVTV